MQRIVYDDDSAMPVELELITNPGAAYSRLARSSIRIGAVGAMRRPALVALVIGASIAMAATREAPAALLVSTTLSWSMVVVFQVIIALAMIRPARGTVGIARALDLFFASHAPWSLWMLAVVAWAPMPGGRPLTPVLIAAIVPLALTFRAITAHFQFVLGLDPRAALRRAILHQAITWILLLGGYGMTVAPIPRLVQWIG